jgi:hypothetical protein
LNELKKKKPAGDLLWNKMEAPYGHFQNNFAFVKLKVICKKTKNSNSNLKKLLKPGACGSHL